MMTTTVPLEPSATMGNASVIASVAMMTTIAPLEPSATMGNANEKNAASVIIRPRRAASTTGEPERVTVRVDDIQLGQIAQTQMFAKTGLKEPRHAALMAGEVRSSNASRDSGPDPASVKILIFARMGHPGWNHAAPHRAHSRAIAWPFVPKVLGTRRLNASAVSAPIKSALRN